MIDMVRESVAAVVGKKGRVVIPVSIRRAAGLSEGTEIVTWVDDVGRVIIDTPSSIKARIRQRAAAGKKMPGSSVEQLIAERDADRSLLD
jgi:AbrB family looped-hinge helix DNA binding protein